MDEQAKIRGLDRRNQYGRQKQRGGVYCQACAALATKRADIEPDGASVQAPAHIVLLLCDDCAKLAERKQWRTLYARVFAMGRWREEWTPLLRDHKRCTHEETRNDSEP